MWRIIPFLSILFIIGCSNSETTKKNIVDEASADKQCTNLSHILNDMNVRMKCDGQVITESGELVFSSINDGKTMAALKYTYTQNDQEKDDYFNGVLKKSSTPIKLVDGKKYTMRCTLISAVFEECTIKPFE